MPIQQKCHSFIQKYCFWQNYNQLLNLLFSRVPLEDFLISQPMPMCGLCPAMASLSVTVELMRVHPYAAYPNKSHCILWWLVISLLASTREQYYVINYESKLSFFWENTHNPLVFFFANLFFHWLFRGYFLGKFLGQLWCKFLLRFF